MHSKLREVVPFLKSSHIYATPTRHFNLHFAALAVNYELFKHYTFYLIWLKLHIQGMWISLSKVLELANIYATPTRHFNLHFAALAVNYELFPQ